MVSSAYTLLILAFQRLLNLEDTKFSDTNTEKYFHPLADELVNGVSPPNRAHANSAWVG